MTREQFYILNNLYEATRGRAKNEADINLNKAVQNKEEYSTLVKKGLIDSNGLLSPKGMKELEKYKVDSAIILAAGSATRFVPLSLEQPKGLYDVYGERLIERQILQLQDAGIQDITVILGYKKDMFVYLKEKFNVRLLFNPAYNVKNNIESILVGKEYISNSYICVCDSYFLENPFHQYEYESYYAGFYTTEKQDEMFAHVDEQGRIIDMTKGDPGGYMLLGHSFWKKDFSKAFIDLAEKDKNAGKYDSRFWEWLVKDNLKQMPPMYYREFTSGEIFEFDYFEQLREFDPRYTSHAHSNIIRNIKLVFRCDEEDIVDFRKVNEGLTNTSFIFRIGEEEYIYRHPGQGTDSIINRRNEKNSLLLARDLGVDPTYIYMDVEEGWKISRYICNCRNPDYNDVEDSKRVASVLRKLHSSSTNVRYGLRPWEDSLEMERLLRATNADCFDQFEGLKKKIYRLYKKTESDGVNKCFCHGDTYKPNWLITPDEKVILIDWEYSGQSDPGVDVGYYIVDAMYDFDEARSFISEYLCGCYSEREMFHYMAYTAIIAYYWFVWAMYRESCGINIGEALHNWFYMATKYAEFLDSQCNV